MKKIYRALFCILIVVCIAFVSYSRRYTIGDSRKQLVLGIMGFGNNSFNIGRNFDIQQELKLDNKKFISFTFNENSLGYVNLTRGLNNKYKIDFTEYGNQYFRDEIVKTNRGKYIILKGKNFERKISYAKVILNSREYEIMIPDQEYFIVYYPVPVETQRVYLDINNIKLFDKNNIDITREMFEVLF